MLLDEEFSEVPHRVSSGSAHHQDFQHSEVEEAVIQITLELFVDFLLFSLVILIVNNILHGGLYPLNSSE